MKVNSKTLCETKLSIFPFKAKFLGLALLVFSIPCAYFYFWGGKPEIFNIKIFAFVTTYLETRYFVVSQTNILDELAAIFFITGIALISFSKEKNEQEYYEKLRFLALSNALFITIVLWLISFLFIYGMAIFIVSFSIFTVFLIMYNLFFRFYLIQDKQSELSYIEIKE